MIGQDYNKHVRKCSLNKTGMSSNCVPGTGAGSDKKHALARSDFVFLRVSAKEDLDPDNAAGASGNEFVEGAGWGEEWIFFQKRVINMSFTNWTM